MQRLRPFARLSTRRTDGTEPATPWGLHDGFVNHHPDCERLSELSTGVGRVGLEPTTQGL